MKEAIQQSVYIWDDSIYISLEKLQTMCSDKKISVCLGTREAGRYSKGHKGTLDGCVHYLDMVMVSR